MTIIATRVSNKNRLRFLPKHFGRYCLQAENYIYDTLSSMCPEYNGAYWHFYELSNQGFYMAPDLSDPLHIEIVSNYYQDDVSADAAGIITSLFALNAFSWEMKQDNFIEAYHLLMDFAEKHSESSQIFTAID